MKVEEIEISKITGNPYQTRLFIEEEPLKILAKSIRERGLFNPITILKKSADNYIVIHGHRRLKACKRLKWKTIPAFVKPRQSKNTLITDLIHENLVREDLSVQEKALSIKLLFSQIKGLKNDIDIVISCISTGKLYNQRGERKKKGKGSRTGVGYKISDDAMFMGMKLLKTIGMSENNAISYLNVLKLPTEIQRKVFFNVHNDMGESSSTRISIRMANHLARVEDKDYQKHLLLRAFQGCSARHIQALVDNYIIKVLKGEWKGFVRKANNYSIMKPYDENQLLELSDMCKKLSRKLQNWKLTKLSAIAEILPKEIFIAESTRLRKEMKLVDNQLKKYLTEKGYKLVKKDLSEPFEIRIKESYNKKNVRGTIPRKILRDLNFEDKDLEKGTFVQLQIIGIKNIRGD